MLKTNENTIRVFLVYQRREGQKNLNKPVQKVVYPKDIKKIQKFNLELNCSSVNGQLISSCVIISQLILINIV